MEYKLENDYSEGSVMHDYCEAIKEDTLLTGLRETLEAADEVANLNGSDMSYDAKQALWDAMSEVERAMSLQSEKILRDIAKEHSEPETVEAD